MRCRWGTACRACVRFGDAITRRDSASRLERHGGPARRAPTTADASGDDVINRTFGTQRRVLAQLPWLLPSAVFFVALVLRLWQIDLTQFEDDQAALLSGVDQFLATHQLPLTSGLSFTVGVRHPPSGDVPADDSRAGQP